MVDLSWDVGSDPNFLLRRSVNYTNTTVWDLYFNIQQKTNYSLDAFTKACNWVEAENDMAINRLYQKWYAWLEDGSANEHYPDPDLPVDADYADKLVAELDDDFEKETLSRVGADAYPEFSRLSPYARLAFAQEMVLTTKKKPAIVKEALGRLAKGEEMPPPEIYDFD